MPHRDLWCRSLLETPSTDSLAHGSWTAASTENLSRRFCGRSSTGLFTKGSCIDLARRSCQATCDRDVASILGIGAFYTAVFTYVERYRKGCAMFSKGQFCTRILMRSLRSSVSLVGVRLIWTGFPQRPSHCLQAQPCMTRAWQYCRSAVPLAALQHCILIPGVVSTWRCALWAICCVGFLMSILPFFPKQRVHTEGFLR